MRHTLKKSEILRGKNNFDLIFRHGRRVEGKYLSCLVLADGRLNIDRRTRVSVAFVSSRALKRAVDRNRFKRLVRESYRLNKELVLPKVKELSKPIALAFYYPTRLARSMGVPTFGQIEHDMKNILQSIVETTLK